MKVPVVTVTYDNGEPRKIVYKDVNGEKIDLTEIMFISKIAWDFEIKRGVPVTTISFDAELHSEAWV